MHTGGKDMDVLVMLEEHPEHSPVLAHVNSVPGPLDAGRSRRDVVTLYGAPTAESLALALAAAVETQRATDEHSGTIRHLGIWPERGAVGDAAWRDSTTGQLVTLDLAVPRERLRETSGRLLNECGQLIRRLVAGLSMPDWPEGARRAIGFSMTPVVEMTAAARATVDSLLDNLREADGLAFDTEGGAD
jgi:hypothetical protein